MDSETKDHKVSVRFSGDAFQLLRNAAYSQGDDLGPYIAQYCQPLIKKLKAEAEKKNRGLRDAG